MSEPQIERPTSGHYMQTFNDYVMAGCAEPDTAPCHRSCPVDTYGCDKYGDSGDCEHPKTRITDCQLKEWISEGGLEDTAGPPSYVPIIAGWDGEVFSWQFAK